MQDVVFSQDVVLKYLLLTSNSFPGPDGIPAIMLKKLARSLAYPLSVILNYSYSHGVVPKFWRQAFITPIFKRSGSRQEAGNCRPVAFTSVVCKLMESIIKDSLLTCILSANLLSKHQRGFCPKRSNSFGALASYSSWISALDSSIPLHVIYFRSIESIWLYITPQVAFQALQVWPICKNPEMEFQLSYPTAPK